MNDVRRRFATADAVYGTILFTALIGTISTDQGNSLEVLIFSVLTLVVFWSAHVYAGTITGHGIVDGETVTLGQSFRNAVRHSSGMLWAVVPASLVLLLGVFHVLAYEYSVNLSLLVSMVILGIIGYLAFAERGSKMHVRILGAIGTAFFGFLMIVLNQLVH